jgi:tripartite-type tricarboxylate transporter receptor subunit TctC
LALLSEKRFSATPDIPTSVEQGFAGLESYVWFGLYAPARTPREIVAALSAEFNRALASPDVKQRLNSLGVAPVGTTPEKFAEAIRAELQQYGELVKRANFRVD